jgi:hypothetical protein
MIRYTMSDADNAFGPAEQGTLRDLLRSNPEDLSLRDAMRTAWRRRTRAVGRRFASFTIGGGASGAWFVTLHRFDRTGGVS